MSKELFNYFDKRHMKEILRQAPSDDGPVITLSRQSGCDGRLVAEAAAMLLNIRGKTDRWRTVDREIVRAVATAIDTDPKRIETFYKGVENSNLSEMIMAVSEDFVSDQTIKRVIEEVVLSICKEGYVVMVGGAGISIAQGVVNSLHVRLTAPFYWRVENVMGKHDIPIDEAEESILLSDERRFKTIQTFLKQRSVNIDYLFDSIINRSRFNINQTASLIVSLYEARRASIEDAASTGARFSG